MPTDDWRHTIETLQQQVETVRLKADGRGYERFAEAIRQLGLLLSIVKIPNGGTTL